MSDGLLLSEIVFGYEAGTPVVDGVRLELRRGELIAIAGPNGCGKSTLLKLGAGLLRPQSGTRVLDGRPLDIYKPRERAACIGYLPQSVAPVFSLEAAEVVALGRFPQMMVHGQLTETDKACILRSMEATNTLSLADRDFQTLSGGERQRVLLAGVLAQEPRYLLLDEPTAALDLHHAAEVFAMLRGLAQQEGYGIVVVSHDVNLASQYCDAMVLLGQNHRLVASGSVDTVITEATLTEAYGAPIQVGRHPFTGLPFAAARSLP